MKRFILIILAIVTFLTCFSVMGCNDEENKGENNNNNNNRPIDNDKNVVEETEFNLVSEAKSDYKIVISAEDSAEINFAVKELQLFFKEATSVDLPVVIDSAVTYSEDSHFISLGQNTVSKSAGLGTANKDVKKEGYLIKTVGKSIFIIGGDDFGTVCGVYGFLSREFNYEFYFTDTYDLDRGVIDVKLKDYDVLDEPDIDRMQAGHSFILSSKDNMFRYRLHERAGEIMPINGNYTVHSIDILLPSGTYGAEHSDWYSANNICFVAHGNSEEYQALINTAFEETKKILKDYPDKEIMYIGQPDNASFCGCDHCKAFVEENGGANSVAILNFCNDLVDKVYAWFETDDGSAYKRDYTIYFLAYQSVLAPPVKEVDGELVSTFDVSEHVGVLFAADAYNYIESPTHFTNENYYNSMKSWSVVAKKFKFWFYDLNFRKFLLPYDTLRYKSLLYQTAYDMGATSVFDEANRQYSIASFGWSYLKVYLESKMRWDVNADLTALTEKFFNACYGSAADTMLSTYYDYRAYYELVVQRWNAGEISANMQSIFSPDGDSAAVWDKKALTKWLDNYEIALQQAKAGAIDDAEYSKIAKMISTERISYLSIMLNNYSGMLTDADYKKYVSQVEEDLANTGITRSNFGEIATLLDSLGLSD